MAQRKCPHKKVTRGKEMHIPVGTSYRHWFHDPEPIVEVRICDACGEWLSIGKAVDRKPEVQVEIRAAEVGQHAEVWRRFMDYDSLVDDDLVRIGAHTWVLSLGSLSPDAGHTCLYPLPRWTPGETIDYWAGWLAREIAEHDELQDGDDAMPPVSHGHENEGRCEGCREPIREGEDVLRYDGDVVTHAHCPEKAATDDIPIRCGAPEVIGLTPRHARARMADGVAAEDALIAQQAERVAAAARHADLDDHLDGCTTDTCAHGCVTDPAAKFGEQARQVTIALPGRVPYAEDQMELPVVDAMYPSTAADVAADALRAGPIRGATPDEIDDAVIADSMGLAAMDEAEQRLSAARDAEFDREREDRLCHRENPLPLTDTERAEVYRILSDVPSDGPETVGGGS